MVEYTWRVQYKTWLNRALHLPLLAICRVLPPSIRAIHVVCAAVIFWILGALLLPLDPYVAGVAAIFGSLLRRMIDTFADDQDYYGRTRTYRDEFAIACAESLWPTVFGLQLYAIGLSAISIAILTLVVQLLMYKRYKLRTSSGYDTQHWMLDTEMQIGAALLLINGMLIPEWLLVPALVIACMYPLIHERANLKLGNSKDLVTLLVSHIPVIAVSGWYWTLMTGLESWDMGIYMVYHRKDKPVWYNIASVPIFLAYWTPLYYPIVALTSTMRVLGVIGSIHAYYGSIQS